MPNTDFHPYDQVCSTFERVLATSPADETELVWFERKHGQASYPEGEADFLEAPRLTVLVRVVEGHRQGWHRTEVADVHQLESGVRHALALAKVQPRVKRRPVLPTDKRPLKFSPQLLDRQVADLDLESCRSLIEDWCGDDLRGRLHWSETRLAVFNSHGVERSAATSELTFEAAAGPALGDGIGGGFAVGSARSLGTLKPEEICERARERRVEATSDDVPEAPVPMLLSAEATVELLNLLNTFAFSARSYLDGTSFLTRHRNDQVFPRDFNLRDDGSRTPGLPFPFDLEGSVKRSLDLIVKGQPSTPALNVYQGSQAGLRPTAQAVGGQDSLFGNLFLLPGEASPEELWAAADGGVSIDWLETPECYEPTQLQLRAKARGVRAIVDGRPGPALPDLLWEGSLLGALARLAAIGNRSVVRAVPTTPLGAISAPAVVLHGSGTLRRLP